MRKKICFFLVLLTAVLFLFTAYSMIWKMNSLIYLESRLQGPSWHAWFGTDFLGRDYFARVTQATVITLGSVFISFLGSTLFGAAYAWLWSHAGHFKFIFEQCLNFFIFFPQLILAFIFSAGIESGMMRVVGSLIFAHWMIFAQFFSTQQQVWLESPLHESAKNLGYSNFELRGEVFWKMHLKPLFGILLRTQWPSFLLTESTLSFLGVGYASPYVGLGSLLGENGVALRAHPHLFLFPLLSLFCLYGLLSWISKKGTQSTGFSNLRKPWIA